MKLFHHLTYMQRNDRVVTLLLLLVAVAALLIVTFVGRVFDSTPPPTGSYAESGVPEPTACDARRGGYAVGDGHRPAVRLQPFAPNTADSTLLLGLGLEPWQVRNIYKYRARGGIYRQPADFARLYGLTQKQYRQLEPYIRISPDYRPASELPLSSEVVSPATRDTLRHSVKLRQGEHIALNLSDTTLLQRVPGIGSAYARAVVNYRNRLGGFHDVSQLLEISGFPESALPYFQVSDEGVKKLKVNKLTLSQLRQHPYINFYMARAICDFRRLNGPLTSLSQLRNNRDFPPEVIRRLEPYIEY